MRQDVLMRLPMQLDSEITDLLPHHWFALRNL